MADFTFTITGRVEAASDRKQALRGLMIALRSFGFTDIGDGTLWLDRPKDPHDELVALGAINVRIDELDVE